MNTAPGSPDDEYRQLTTLAGWRKFAAEIPSAPELLPDDVWRNLGEDKRLAYDEDRLGWHARLVTVQTPAITRITAEGRRLSYLNRAAVSGRCGIILSGPGGSGKSTALSQLGKMTEAVHHRRHHRTAGDIPVLYIIVPPAATPKMIAVELARFLGLPVSRRMNITDITEAVCGVCLDTRTSLVCVDEIHNIDLATRAGAEASDALKYFSERIPATFAYAGINVEKAGLLSGTRGEQIAGRFSMTRTGPFPRNRQWAALAAALETSLRLHRHEPGTLTGLSGYLHQRTGGMIGSLLRLVRSAAVQAILDGTETVTRKTLDAIDVDIAASTRTPGRKNA